MSSEDEVESLRELRQVAGKAQAEIALALNIKQPSVSKIEKHADMYLSTLRSYVEAVGGELDIVVKLPASPPVTLRSFGDLSTTSAQSGKKGQAFPPDWPLNRRHRATRPA